MIDYKKFEGHTPGPWRRGRVLSTPRTRDLPPDAIAAVNAEERKEIYAYFTDTDQGRSRRRLFTGCWVWVTEADMNLAESAPDLLAENKALREELIKEKTYFCDQVCTRKHLCDECDDKKRIEELKGGE